MVLVCETASKPAAATNAGIPVKNLNRVAVGRSMSDPVGHGGPPAPGLHLVFTGGAGISAGQNHFGRP